MHCCTQKRCKKRNTRRSQNQVQCISEDVENYKKCHELYKMLLKYRMPPQNDTKCFSSVCNAVLVLDRYDIGRNNYFCIYKFYGFAVISNFNVGKNPDFSEITISRKVCWIINQLFLIFCCHSILFVLLLIFAIISCISNRTNSRNNNFHEIGYAPIKCRYVKFWYFWERRIKMN